MGLDLKNPQIPLDAKIRSIVLGIDNPYDTSEVKIAVVANDTIDFAVYNGAGMRIGCINPVSHASEGAKFQLFSDTHPSYGGQVYFDSGSAVGNFLSFRVNNSVECLRLNSDNNAVFYGGLITPTSQPSTPEIGHIYFDTGDNHFYGYNGTSWVRLDN